MENFTLFFLLQFLRCLTETLLYKRWQYSTASPTVSESSVSATAGRSGVSVVKQFYMFGGKYLLNSDYFPLTK